MSRTIVNIITEDEPVLNYLFIKEMYQPGDRLLFISEKDEVDDLNWLASLTRVSSSLIDKISIGGFSSSYAWESLCKSLYRIIDEKTTYLVNLAGGTRFMALVVQHVFERFHSTFFYVPRELNVITTSKFDNSLNDNDDLVYPIQYRMDVEEYLRCYGITAKSKKPARKAIDSEDMFQLFTSNCFTNSDYEIMAELRTRYGNNRCVRIAEVESPSNPNRRAIPGLSEFLEFIHFEPIRPGWLNNDEIHYLIGGWFEEYVYYLIKKKVKPDDLAISVEIRRPGSRHKNELDVAFIKGNRLYVIECKTGVQTERLFNEIVYKACALHETMLGMDSLSYIFSLKRDESGELRKTASNMDICFCDYSTLTSNKINAVLKKMVMLGGDKK